jgi:hypothetical protein
MYLSMYTDHACSACRNWFIGNMNIHIKDINFHLKDSTSNSHLQVKDALIVDIQDSVVKFKELFSSYYVKYT